MRLLLDYADIEIGQGKGCCALAISRRGLDELRGDQADSQTLDRLSKVVAIVAGRTVVTQFRGIAPRRYTARRARRSR